MKTTSINCRYRFLLSTHPVAPGYMTTDAFNIRMRGVLMGNKLRCHYMAGLPTKLDRLHTLYRAIGTLRSDDNMTAVVTAKKIASLLM